MQLRYVALALLMTLPACAARRPHSNAPSVPPSSDPREQHVLDETARFAAILGVNVRGVLTDHVYNVRCSDGTICPAAGWYADGRVYFWRPAILSHDDAYGTALAAHEVAHSLFHDDAEADTCANNLLTLQ